MKKSLYGFKQIAKQWYNMFDGFSLKSIFLVTNVTIVVTKKSPRKFMSSYWLYVGHMMIVSASTKHMDKLNEQLTERFSIKDLEVVM